MELLEHINFKIPYASGEPLVHAFFVTALGCPECPTGRKLVCFDGGIVPKGDPKQMHVNLGLSQIHFEWCTGTGVAFTTPQRIDGHVEIQIDDIEALRMRLKRGKFDFFDDSIGRVVVTDPFGTTWVARQAEADVVEYVHGLGQIRPGGVGHVLAMDTVEYLCRPGVGETIMQCYRGELDATIEIKPKQCVLYTNRGQRVVFTEFPNAPEPNAYETQPSLFGTHMCFYICDFESKAHSMERKFWVNPDYVGPPINDNVKTTPEALARKQFRFKNVGLRWVFEHEIRDVDHPLSPLTDLPQASKTPTTSKL